MSKRYESITGNVVDTTRSTIIGAERHPGWHALRKLAARITTPLLPDAYLHLAMCNRGILMTPFHNMALMCPETSREDVDRHTEVFREVVGALYA